MLDVEIDYTDYKGQRGWRRIRPIHLYFGSTLFHPENQWLLVAHDYAKGEERTFALQSIHQWRKVI